MEQDEIEGLRLQAMKCRRLAANSFESQTRVTLLEMAAEYEAEADALDRERTSKSI
jgi:hypothetical protein